MNPFVSVIIPVYNAGESLHSCVNSLLKQTLKNIELIFVLDCPTDGSDKLIYEYAQKYSQIVVISNNKNLNIGESRNVGLKKAKGEYVAFCDHDDIVEPFMYEEIYNHAVENNADIVLGVPRYCYTDSSLNESFYYPDIVDIKSRLLSFLIGQDSRDSLEWKFFFSHGVIWDNIYRRSVIEQNNIKFVDNNKCTFEDNLFLISYLLAADSAYVYNKHCYNHIITGNNTSSNSNYTKYPLILEYINTLNRLLEQHKLKETYTERFSNTVVMYITGAFVSEVKKNKYKLWKTSRSYSQMKQLSVIGECFRYCTLKPYSNNLIKNMMLKFVNLIFRL